MASDHSLAQAVNWHQSFWAVQGVWGHPDALCANMRELRASLVPVSFFMHRGSCAKISALLLLLVFPAFFVNVHRVHAWVFTVHTVYFLLICTNLVFHSLHFLYFNKNENVISDPDMFVKWQQQWHIYKKQVRLSMLPTTTMLQGRKESMKCPLCE